MAYTLDEFLKLNKGYTKSYDPITKMAGVQNTNTGKSINFTSGQGAEYGFGGLENDSNVITDLNKFRSALDNPVESVTEAPKNAYESPYSEQISATLASLSSRPAFKYDPSSDQGLAAAQENAMSTVSREAARRGMLYSDSNKSQLGKSSMALIPQFEQVASNRYNQENQDMYNMLNSLSGLENTNYNKYRDQTNSDLAAKALEREQFIQTLPQYSNDYKAFSNSILSDNDPTNDWKSALALTARQDKIINNKLDQNGNPIQTGFVNEQAQQALDAYNSGFRTPEVISILKNAGYQFPTTTGGGSSAKYTTEQYNNYVQLKNNYMSGNWNKSDMIKSLTTDKTLQPMLGDALYKQLLDDAMNFKSPEGMSEREKAEEALAIAKAKKELESLNTPQEEPFNYSNVKQYATALDAMGEEDIRTGNFVPNKMEQAKSISQWLDNGVITETEAWELANQYKVQDIDISGDSLPIPSWAK